MRKVTRKRKSQAVVEYFLAFALIIILTVLGFNAAIKTVKDKSKDFFVRKVNDMGPVVSPGGNGGFDEGGDSSNTGGNPGSNSGGGNAQISIYDQGQNGAYLCNGNNSCYTSSSNGFKDLYNPNALEVGSEDTFRLHFEISTLDIHDRRNVVQKIPDSFRIFIPPGTIRVMIQPECFCNADVAMGYHYKAPLENTSFHSLSEIPDTPEVFINYVSGNRTLEEAQSRDIYSIHSMMNVGDIGTIMYNPPFTVEDSGWLYAEVFHFNGFSGLKDLWVDIDIDADTYFNWYNNVGQPGSDYVWDVNSDPVER